MAKTNAQKQRAMRQEELRELLSKKGLVQQVIVDIGKIDELADAKAEDFDSVESYTVFLNAAKDKAYLIKTAIDARMKLVNKYLPDLKQAEITMEAEHSFAQVSDELTVDDWQAQHK